MCVCVNEKAMDATEGPLGLSGKGNVCVLQGLTTCLLFVTICQLARPARIGSTKSTLTLWR